MKKLLYLAILVLLLVLVVSCTQEQKDSYLDYPLSGLIFSAPSCNASVFAGTYIGTDYLSSLFGYGNYYHVSFRNDGTLTASPIKGLVGSKDDERVNGTWSLEGSSMTISVYGETFTGTKYDVQDAGFRIEKTSTDKVGFVKENDYQLSPVTSSSLAGLWFATDDYGKNNGYRFLSDGTVYEYQSDGTTIKNTWALSTKGTKILIGELYDYNIAIIGDYLYIQSVPFQRVN